MTTGIFHCIFVGQNLTTMKEKKERKLKQNGNEKKQAVENEKNNNVQNDAREENPDTKPATDDSWAYFFMKLIKMMIAIEDLVEAKKNLENDPRFVAIIKRFMELQEKYEEEHLEEMEEVDDDYEFEDKELFNIVQMMKHNLQSHGIQVKVRKVTDPEEIRKFESIMRDIPQKNGTAKTYDA